MSEWAKYITQQSQWSSPTGGQPPAGVKKKQRAGVARETQPAPTTKPQYPKLGEQRPPEAEYPTGYEQMPLQSGATRTTGLYGLPEPISFDEEVEALNAGYPIQPGATMSTALYRPPEHYTVKDYFRVLGQSLLKVPKQTAATILQATQGQGGASVVNRDWADEYIREAAENLDKFVLDIAGRHTYAPTLIREAAFVSQNLAYSITSMGAGLIVGVPIAFIPAPGMRVVAWGAGTAASGAVAYQMTTYQIMQQYLELKNAEKIEQTGKGITLEEENALKQDFHSKAVKYGLWEAIPEALSNLAFAQFLGGPLGKMIGGSMATKLIAKIAGIYGEELLTETITQKGQSAIEVEAGLREERIGWIEAFKEIAPQTFLLTTIMAGAGQVIISSSQAIKKITTSLKNEIGTDHILYDEIKKGIETELEAVTITPETVTGVEPTITEAPTIAMAEGVEVTLADILMPARRFLNKPTIEAMIKGYREGNPAIIERPIAVRETESGFEIIEGEHRAVAAKEAGVEPHIVVLTEAQVEGLNAPEVDALAREVYAQRTGTINTYYPTGETTAMAEGETVSGKPELTPRLSRLSEKTLDEIVNDDKYWKYAGEDSPILEARYKKIKDFTNAEIEALDPWLLAQFNSVSPRISEAAESMINAVSEWKLFITEVPTKVTTPPVTEVTPEVTKPTAPEVAKTGFEGLERTIEGEAIAEVAGVPPKKPTNWDKVGGALYDNFMRQTMPNPTPGTIPLGDRVRRAWGKVETIVTDEFARLNKLGWQTEVDVSYVRSADSRSAQLYNRTMKRVGDSLGWDSNLLSHTANYLTLRHQLEVLKATGRKYFTVQKGDKSTTFTAKQIGLIFAQMKKELGADYARVKEAASHFPAVYNQILRETSELTPEQIEGIIRKYPWFNPIIPVRETAPINIGKRLSTRQIRNLTHLEVDTEQISPLLALPTTISKRIKANAINDAKKSIAHSAVELSQNPKDRVLIGGDVEIVIKKPTGAFIDFFEGGQRKYVKLGKGTEWVAKDIELFQRQPPGMLIKGVRSLQGVSKMFFTTYNPGFMVWNTLFDAYTSFVTEGIWPWVFVKNLGQNVAALFTEVPSVSAFREAGAELFGFFGKGAEVGRGREITPFISEKGGQLVLKNPEGLKRLLNPFVLVKELGIAGENAGRKATFEKAKAEGLSDKEAVLRGRRVTVDFSRFSRASRFINDWYIYFNPALQGFFLPGRAMRKDPRTLWRLSALIAGYVGLTLYNMSYDEYDDVRDSDKTGKLLVMLPSDEYNKYGQKVPHYLTLMPLREFALFTAPIEYFLGKVTTEYPDAYRTLAQEWDVLYPVISPLSMISETGGLVFPTQIGATIQQIINNHDDFRDRPIVDDEMALLPPAQQYDQYTNGLAIKAGQALGMSPKKLDFFASNMFGALGNDFLREINRAIEAIDREQVDERIAGLVSDLREIPMTVPPNQIEVARETFLEGLSVEDRELVLNMENLPDDKIPFVQSMVRRFFRDYGGQVYATAKEKALMDRTLEDYPPEALAKLQKDAIENANNLLNGKITKKQYDDARTRYRAYYSGAGTAEWREGMTEGAVARSDVDKYMPESYQRSEEFQAVSAYMEIREEYIDEAGGVFDSEIWDEIENKTLADLRKDYSERAVQYAILHKDDWIDKLPEPARTVERQRAIAIENETWWDDYRGDTSPTSWAGSLREGTTSGSAWAESLR